MGTGRTGGGVACVAWGAWAPRALAWGRAGKGRRAMARDGTVPLAGAIGA